MDTTFKTEQGKFNYRVISLVTNKECDKFLMYSAESIDFWVSFGGRCKLGEFSAQTVERELQEELGELKISQTRLIGSAENIFLEKDKPFHEISFIYHIILADDEPLLKQTGVNPTIEDNDHIQKWLSLEEFSDYKIFPLFLPEVSANIKKFKQNLPMQHYVANEL